MARMITDWRKWLAILTPEEKKRLMGLLNVSYSTLSQWINSERRPRPRHLYGLVLYNPELRDSIEREFPDVLDDIRESEKRASMQIPGYQYEDILKSFAFLAEAVSGQTIAHKVFAYMSAQLDPEEEGLLLLPSLCAMDDEIVTRLHTTDGHGTGLWKRPPWAHDHEYRYYDLGRDSLAGTAVTRRRMVLYPMMGILDHRPFARDHEKIASAAAFPIWRRGKLAGALVVASVHADFFQDARCELSARYTDLYALSLYDHQFYDPQRIALQTMREGIDVPETNGVD